MKLSQLRVVADMDVESYVRGAAQKEAADKRIVESSKAVGQALAAQDAQAAKLGVGVASLSRSFIEGYGPAAKFEQAVRALGNAVDKGLDAGRAAATYGGIVTKFGQFADVTALAKANFVSLVPVVSAVNRQFDAMAAVQERAAQASQRLAQAQQAQAQINSQLGAAGIGRQTGGYDPARLAVLEAEAIRQEKAGLQAEIARREAIGGALGRDINSRMGIGQGTLDARGSAAAFEQSFAKQEAVERAQMQQRAEMLKQSLLPMQAEQERSRKNLEDIDKLEKARVITIETAGKMREAEALRTEQAKKSIEGMFIHQSKYANATGLARNEVVNLSRQLQDVVVTLQAGQPLSTILLQQGTQIADIFTSSNATMKGFFQQATAGVAGFATSVAGMATALLAVGAAATYIGTQYGNAQREVERLVSGLGRGSGATVGSINSVAETLSGQQRISTASARDVASIVASTGRISGSNIFGVSNIARDFAAQTGNADLKAAAKELTDAFSGDVVKGAEQLNEKLGFLDNRTREYIRTLQAQGDRQGAIKATLDAMTPSIDKAAERVSWFTLQWERLKKAASDAADATGRALTGPSTQERLSSVQAEIDRLQARGVTPNSVFGGKAARELRELMIQKDALEGELRIRKELAEFEEKSARDRRASNDAGALIRGFDTDVEKVKELREELTKLEKAQNDAGVRTAVGNDAGLNRATEATQNALRTSVTNVERLRREGDLIVQGTMARTLDEQKAVAIERERLNMAGQKLTTLQQELMIQNQILQVQSQAAREARDANRQATDSFNLAGLRPFQAALLRNRQQNRDLRDRTESFNQPAGGGQRDSNIPTFSGKLDPLSLIMKYESGGRNIMQQAVGPNGGYNPSTGTITGPSSASGYFQMINPTWRSAAKLAGLDISMYPRAMDAPYDMQRQAAAALFQKEGFSPWAPYNAKLRDAIRDAGGTKAFGLGGSPIANDNIRGANVDSLGKADATTAIEFINVKLREQEDALKNQNEQLVLQERNFQKSTYEVNRAAKEQELLQNFYQQGVPLTSALREEVAKLADAYGKTSANAVTLTQMQGAIQDRQMLFLSDTDRNIAGRIGYQNLSAPIADYMRLTSAIQQSSEMASSFLNDIASAAMRGKLGIDTLRNAALKLGDQIVSMLLNNAVRQFMGMMFNGGGAGGGFSLFGGGGGFAPGATTGTGGLFAKGGVFAGGNVVPFAKGGVVSSPVMFPFAKGIGLMGEAGPEAIMPLKRGKNGSLGVQMMGAGSGTIVAPQVNVQINNQTPAQVQQRTEPDGTIVMDILDGHLAQAVVNSSTGKGALSGFADPRVAASRRPG